MAAIELQSLHKQFGDVAALRGIDLTIEEGSVFGLIGPHGAGKSTLIDLILGYKRSTSGRAALFGHDPQSDPKLIRQHTGLLPQTYQLDGFMTARQHISFTIASLGVPTDPETLLARVGLRSEADSRVSEFTDGTLQRLTLAMALVGDPELLVLDEPTAGMSPSGVEVFQSVIQEEQECGTTILFSTQTLGQVEAVCSEFGVLVNGSLTERGSIERLRALSRAESLLRVTLDTHPNGMIDFVNEIDGVSNVTLDDDTGTVTVSCPPEKKAAVIDTLRADGAQVLDIESNDLRLDELFSAGRTHTEQRI